jgi:hypothetical protein
MECPFCAQDFNDTALVCKSCGRDLRLVLPLIEESQELVRRAGKLQLQVNRLRATEERRAAPLKFCAVHFGVYLLAPIGLLLATHYVITVAFDLPPLYLRLGSIAIPLPFGLALLMFSHHGIRWAALYGAIVGFVGVIGMLTVVGITDNIAILPEKAREWREVLEYAASIMLAYMTGNALGALAQRMVPKTLDASAAPSPAILYAVRVIGGPTSSQTLRRRAQKISENLGMLGTAAGAVGTAGASVFAGVRALVGSG